MELESGAMTIFGADKMWSISINSGCWRKASLVAARSCKDRGELEDCVWNFFDVNLVNSWFQPLKSKDSLRFETFLGIGVVPKHL